VSLERGTRLGPYEIESVLGAGGMGEVYRARDTLLKRDVAIKVLPQAFAGDPDRIARFQREAEVLATLNHPNIAAIHGLQDSDSVRSLVLEFVDGPTLADLIGGRPMPLDNVLAIARQIADALEAAHERGIIHRDLKPANVKVRPDGTVKVLDFGLAKALEARAPQEGVNFGVSQSPTITSPAMTRVGVVLGTAAYMSPEQARGHDADERSDLWAFGCVLFEMLTGRRAFEGEEVSDTLAAVLRAEPDQKALPAATPASVRRLLRRCLEKNPKRRLADIRDARLELDESSVEPLAETPSGSTRSRTRCARGT
jgi:serine/threonine protein kinase